MKINYLIVEDVEMVSVALKTALDDYADLNFVGAARGGREAVEMALHLKPDLIIMDIDLPELSGIDATRKICHVNPDIKVLMLTGRDSADDIFESFMAGATGYASKQTDIDTLHKMMHAVISGEISVKTDQCEGTTCRCETQRTDWYNQPAEIDITARQA